MNKRLVLNIFLLLGIIFLFLFFRFYNITERFAFAWDQEHIANEVYTLLVNKKLTLIGPRANNDLGFYLGPYFTYLIAPFFVATHLHPNAMILFVFVAALIFITLSLTIISTVFTYPIALLFLFLWGLNPYLIQLDMTAWWPVIIPSGSLLFLFFAYRMATTRKSYYPLLLGALCGFFTNMHFQFAFITLISLLIVLFKSETSKRRFIDVVFFITSFTSTLIPLFIFDLRHNFLNLTLFLNFFFGKSTTQLGSNSFAFYPVFLNIVKSFFPTSNPILLSLFGLCILLSPLIFIQNEPKKIQRHIWLVIFSLNVVTIIGYMIYGKRPSEYYFLFLIPFFILTICKLGMINRYTKIVLILYILFSLYMNRNTYQRMLTRPAYAYMALKERVILEIEHYAKDKNINVTFRVPAGDNNGYRYFMKLYNIKESGNWSDPLIEVQIPPQKGNIIMSSDIGIKIPPELKK